MRLYISYIKLKSTELSNVQKINSFWQGLVIKKLQAENRFPTKTPRLKQF